MVWRLRSDCLTLVGSQAPNSSEGTCSFDPHLSVGGTEATQVQELGSVIVWFSNGGLRCGDGLKGKANKF